MVPPSIRMFRMNTEIPSEISQMLIKNLFQVWQVFDLKNLSLLMYDQTFHWKGAGLVTGAGVTVKDV